ncbi:hypothetical protein QVD99_005279 [Batrachochytrium dendrobatidis]|nr:hypothetical protein QVD99_005279 [Batrachochytrium dendrobatidis]
MSKKLQFLIIEPFQNQIKELEASKKAYFATGQEHNRNVRDAFHAMRKSKKDMDSLQVAAIDASQNFQRAQYNPGTKEKEISKYAIKATTAQDKADHAKDKFTACEMIANAAEEDYYGRLLPELYQNLRRHEEDRCYASKSVLERANLLEIKMAESHMNALKDLAQKISNINVEDDIESFVSCHMTRNDDREMIKGFHYLLSGELKRGIMHIRKNDTLGNWKVRVAIFRQEQHLLNLYDMSDMIRPKEVIFIENCAIHCIDSSAFGKPSFQIIQSEGDKSISYTCVTESELARDDWAEVLRQYARCCNKCARLNGFSVNTKRNENLVNKNSSKYKRSLTLRIIEAKDLKTPPGMKTITPYCAIFLDDVNFARTVAKTAETSIWTESFMFHDIAAHFGTLRIILLHPNRLSKDTTIGYVTINLQSLFSGVKMDQWHQIKNITEDGAIGSLRISCTLMNEQILQSSVYGQFLELITEPNLTAVKTLGRIITQEREEFARSFLNLMRALNREREGICILVHDEISSTEDPNIIFRGNTLATKVVDQYMKAVGAEYLQSILSPLIAAVYENGESCEADPTRLDSFESAKKNVKRLLQFVFLFWDSIQKSSNAFPSKIVEIFAYIKEVVSKRFVDQQSRGEQVKYPAISGFLFLRFFCPAIISPHQFGLTNDIPTGNVLRTLTMIAKILQNLANLTELKDSYMTEVNGFIRGQKDAMRDLLERVSTIPIDLDAPLDIQESDTDVDRYCESMYQFFERYNVSIAAANKVPEYHVLAAAIESIKSAHESHSDGMAEFVESCKRNDDEDRGYGGGNTRAEIGRLNIQSLSREIPPPICISKTENYMPLLGDLQSTLSNSSVTTLGTAPTIPPRSEQRMTATRVVIGNGSVSGSALSSPVTASTDRTLFPTKLASDAYASPNELLSQSPVMASPHRYDLSSAQTIRKDNKQAGVNKNNVPIHISTPRISSAAAGTVSLVSSSLDHTLRSNAAGISETVPVAASPVRRPGPLRATPTIPIPPSLGTFASPTSSRGTSFSVPIRLDSVEPQLPRARAEAPRLDSETTFSPFSVNFDTNIGGMFGSIPEDASNMSHGSMDTIDPRHNSPSRTNLSAASTIHSTSPLTSASSFLGSNSESIPSIPQRTHSSGALLDDIINEPNIFKTSAARSPESLVRKLTLSSRHDVSKSNPSENSLCEPPASSMNPKLPHLKDTVSMD